MGYFKIIGSGGDGCFGLLLFVGFGWEISERSKERVKNARSQ
jgi:hypothetical protein